MNKLLAHLKTIRKHRKYVRQMCFRMGIPWQGIIHDLSKYSPTELSIYKYYDGSVSPHQRCREATGFSPSWNHHYHRNKHHWEYWLDNQDACDFTAVKMPYKYVIEMFCDMVGAGKAYMKDAWTTSSPLQYYDTKCRGQRLMHKDSEKLLVTLFETLSKKSSLNEFVIWYKNNKNQLFEMYN